MCNRWPFMIGRDFEIIRYATRHILKAFAEAPHRQIIEKYWNTTMEQINLLVHSI